MKRQLGIIAFACIFSLIGCSNRNSAPVEVERATDTDTTPSNTDVYDTTQTTNSNLWDTTTNSDVPAGSPSPTPSASPSASSSNGGGTNYPAQWNCLNGGSNYAYPQSGSTGTPSNGTTPPWYGTNSNNSASMSRACFDSSWGGDFGEDYLYGAGLGAFGSMHGCYQMVMSRAPQYCTSGYNVEEVFKMSQMALTRCFRNILHQQMQMAHWSQPQTQAYQQNDSSFYYLLTLFSQGEGSNN